MRTRVCWVDVPTPGLVDTRIVTNHRAERYRWKILPRQQPLSMIDELGGGQLDLERFVTGDLERGDGDGIRIVIVTTTRDTDECDNGDRERPPEIRRHAMTLTATLLAGCWM